MNSTSPSFAKINLHLEVLGRREDGYHDLRTLFQSIDLADDVELELGGAGTASGTGQIRLELTGDCDGLDARAGNLAWRAVAAFREEFGSPAGAVTVRLHKRIPRGGGLGGGSSNAATVLWLLARACGVPQDRPELARVAASLGADVPFFLVGGTCLGTGRGDRLEPLPDLREEALLVALPDVELSTRAVFEAYRPAPLRQAPSWLEVLRRGDFREPLVRLDAWNDLEPVALDLCPGLAGMYAGLTEAGAQVVRMTGSGSSFVGYLPAAADRSADLRLPERLDQAGIRLLVVRTLSRQSLAQLRAGGRHGDHRGEGPRGE